jgi:glutamate/tyrosine decarboxylase-like PLP-dependent enzyme
MYPSAGSMEQDVVRSVADLLRGDDQVVGSMTSGGTRATTPGSTVPKRSIPRSWCR